MIMMERLIIITEIIMIMIITTTLIVLINAITIIAAPLVQGVPDPMYLIVLAS